MADVTDLINRLCESCRDDYDPAFNADPRLSETIAGDKFIDPAAAVQNVNVNGTSVSALNIAVIDSTTVQCVFDIGNLAALGNRDVTVSMGGKNHTLLNAFNVTA
ncbi:hypothetical protein [Piscinibacter sp.]|uniref:hypothetical protein n=1 Tax=Piscinibacter sp. TaxID=1903157 RepID=UPI002BE34732|nr:hypothetical protein [Albitalea sp.]HUG24165.1 hypothetical protein [Albitalea sp.]